MGLKSLVCYDEDGVEPHNLPNQFFRKNDLDKFKVEALGEMLREFTDTQFVGHMNYYTNQRLAETVVVATHTMASRKLVWEQFLKQDQAHYLIEARMGAQQGRVYCIRKQYIARKRAWVVTPSDIKFYAATLYDDSEVPELPCTARSIIYNVLMIASLIARAYKAVVMEETAYPKEVLFNLTYLDVRSFMCGD